MSEFNIVIPSGESKRLKTGGKYCPDDIVVTAEGSGGGYHYENDGNPFVNHGKYAYVACDAFESVYFPNATEIALGAFHGCTNLTTIDFPLAEMIFSYAFSACKKLTSVNLPSAKSIAIEVFFECTSLERLDLPKVTNIYDRAFMDCTSLNTLILRTTETVCVCDFSAFNNTPMLTGQGHIYVPSVMYEQYRAGYESALNELMSGFFDILFRKIEDYPEICG